MKKLKLNDKDIKLLSELPEHGMGYQIVDIFLNNGNVLQKRIVLNSTFLQMEEHEKLNLEEIKKIELHLI